MREDRAQDVPKRFSAYSPLKDSILGLMAEKQSTERRFQSRDLESFVARALIAVGLPASDADQVAQLMILADLRGSDGHGIFRLPQYIRRIRAGGMNLRPNIHIVQETDATALVDGDNGIGHLVMRFATRVAMEKAGRSGIGWVGVQGSNHAGPAALYAMMPLELNMIGIYLAVGSANHMPPWGGVELLLSTNPIAFAVPASEEPPIVLDIATSVTAYGKVKTKAQRGEQMPEGWMINAFGQPFDRSKARRRRLPAADRRLQRLWSRLNLWSSQAHCSLLIGNASWTLL